MSPGGDELEYAARCKQQLITVANSRLADVCTVMRLDLAHRLKPAVRRNRHRLDVTVALDHPEDDDFASSPQPRLPCRAPPNVVSSHSRAPSKGSRSGSSQAQHARQSR
jgi:hypothetical protein